MAAGVVANWGNDNNVGTVVDGNNITDTEWKNANRTFQGAKDAGLNLVYATGWFNESLPSNTYVYSKGKLVLDLTNISTSVTQYTNALNDAKIINSSKIVFSDTGLIRSHVDKCMTSIGLGKGPTYSIISNSTLATISIGYKTSTNLTYHNVTTVQMPSSDLTSSQHIFSNVQNLNLTTDALSYSLVINSALMYTGGGLGTDETTYTYPTGATDEEKLQNLRDRMSVVYGGMPSDYLLGCKYYSGSYNDIFVDADNGDFNLVPYCIAAHMSYEGDYIGARPEGIKADWSADWLNLVNISTAGYVLDQTVDSSANTVIQDLSHVRQILNLSDVSNLAYRNGQQINTESNLGTVVNPGTAVLTAGTVYMVQDDVAVLDDALSTSLDPFTTFIAIDEGVGSGLGFTSAAGSVIEVLISKYDSKSRYQFSKTDSLLSTAATITCFNDVSPVMVNVDINGEPILGDADVGYDANTAVVLYSRYIRRFLLIKANSLPAR